MLNLDSRITGVLLLAALLNGCAYAPGMYVGRTNTNDTSQNSSWFSTQPDMSADAPPSGRIIAITPSLIREQRKAKPIDVSAEVKQLFDLAQPYRIGVNDVLNIVVWDHPELSVPAAGGLGTDVGSLSGVGNGFNVSPDGLIQFPYAGTIKLSGLTEYEARDLLTARLAKYIKDPQVTVRIQSYRSGRIYIDGEVRTPGLQALNEIPMTLPEAISRSGGLTAVADRSSIVITRNGQSTRVNLPLLLQRNINPNQILLRNGDLVQVLGSEETKVFVMGEVTRPNTQTLRNGHLTLNEALGDAGGVSQITGDPRQIFVVRAANTEQPEIYHLDAQSPTAFALAEGFELKARDVIYVDPVPIVRWNRVISLILPSAQAVTTTRNVLN
ncbi:MAG: sugar transporter [Rhodoferax sp.]|nr:sugar transporter [Betaproteobacteria bacterium]NCN97871.1 sugar transporter [Rhodoferax sp.]OIP18542.1 MAG: sugar transporter [Comamonadaceae bacterium CG2_30_57_122]PIZ23975.1 MAG: sugar transporter [Comamonadaceae bacterium CG_4_10_14_0_8_um_filter_57_29]PJC17853.1 MAG: sugar transporter [Comamonadaceae bacterium CG_4_9_14_0_8_um_filter_57_21]